MIFKRSSEVNMTEGPLFFKIVLFTVPLMLSGILQLLYGTADMIVVGQFVGDNALAAIGATGALTSLIVGLFLGLSTGTSVAVAHAIGAREDNDVKEIVSTSLIIAVVGGIIIGFVGVFCSEYFLALMQTPPEVIKLSAMYMRIIFIGMPAQLLYNYASAVLRAKGDTTHPLMFLAIAGVINIILNLLLVIVFHLGVAGVAVATIASQVVSSILCVLNIVKTEDCCQIKIREIRIYKEKLYKILKIGLPAGIQGSLFSFSNVIIQSSINSFGAAAMAGNAAGSNIDGYIYTSMNSLYHASLTFVGQNVGAKKLDRTLLVAKNCFTIVAITGLSFGLLAFIFKEPLLSVFIKNNPEAIEYGIMRLSIVATLYVFCGLMEVSCGMLRGIGASMTSMFISLGGACIFRIVWIYTIFAEFPSMKILYLSYPVSWALTSSLEFIAFLIILKKLRKRLESQQLLS